MNSNLKLKYCNYLYDKAFNHLFLVPLFKLMISWHINAIKKYLNEKTSLLTILAYWISNNSTS